MVVSVTWLGGGVGGGQLLGVPLSAENASTGGKGRGGIGAI